MWTRRALREVDAAFEWIVAENPRAAAEVIDRLWAATRILGEHSRMGRPGRIVGTRELVESQTPYIAVYREKAGQIEILAVLHHAREWPRDL
ncbi:MAG TPA: type II toxin-antitoxin system RelE/ParE family toxin [Thermohalobaculum sp.]|nr:type II toxin-antitoxin system RelE/ParE family toxin [Thermohalobaculum sp.]